LKSHKGTKEIKDFPWKYGGATLGGIHSEKKKIGSHRCRPSRAPLLTTL